MTMEDSTGLREHPCSTPHVVRKEYFIFNPCSTETTALILLYIFTTILNRFPCTPFCNNTHNSFFLSTISNALRKSIKADFPLLLVSIELKINCSVKSLNKVSSN